jgi:nucleoid-associated protein YgaU
MAKKTMNKQKLFAALPVLAALCVFSSCASSPAEPETADSGAVPGESQLLDDSSKVAATDVPEAGAFADLDSAKKKDESPSASAPAAAGDTYYTSLGGETMRRVAYTLYSSKSASKGLLEKNPDLKGLAKLSADQKVFFDMDSARPEPRYLTKDLLSRYAEPLAERLNIQASAKGMQKTDVTVNKGESLQDVSQRLYGTHRYWTEIYLVNRGKIKNYDRIPAGLTLSVLDRPNSGVAKAEAPAAAVASTEEPSSLPPVVKAEPKPLPAVAPSGGAALPPPPIQETTQISVTSTPLDPMPETSPAPMAEKVAPAPVPVPIVAPPPPPPIKAVAIQEVPRSIPTASARIDSGESSNSSLRRILYFVLVLAIGGAAFYFTRTPKRPTVDMLDAGADGSRPKLSPKDSHHSQIG